MGEETTPAGLSKLYVCRADDLGKDPAPLQEIDLEPHTQLEGHRIDFQTHAQNATDDGYGEGWTVTLTGSLEISEDFKRQQKKDLRRMLFGEGRLPRKELKRRMNRVLRDRMAVMAIYALMRENSCMVQSVIASYMFPEQIKLTTDGSFVITPIPAQLRAAYLCMKRIPRMAIKMLRKHRKELWQDIEKLESLCKSST